MPRNAPRGIRVTTCCAVFVPELSVSPIWLLSLVNSVRDVDLALYPTTSHWRDGR
jgi:hypothetical protein